MSEPLANSKIDKAARNAAADGPGLPRPTATAQPAMFAFTSQAPGAVRPYLLLGAAPHESDYSLLKKLGVTHILQVGKELRPTFPDRFVYCRLALEDNENEDLVSSLPTAFAFIDAAREEGRRRQEEEAEAAAAAAEAGNGGAGAPAVAATADGASGAASPSGGSPSGGGGASGPAAPPCVVLVHCMAGMSRSASVCVAYLMADPQERERAERRERERAQRHATAGTPARLQAGGANAATDGSGAASPAGSSTSSPAPLARPAGAAAAPPPPAWGYEAAFRAVKAARPCVYPNLGFLLQLWDWESAGCGRTAADLGWPGWNKHRFAERLAAYRRAQAAAGLHPAVRVKLPLEPPGAAPAAAAEGAAIAEAPAGPAEAGAAAAAAHAGVSAAAAQLRDASLQPQPQAQARAEVEADPEMGGAAGVGMASGGGGWAAGVALPGTAAGEARGSTAVVVGVV
ncbi:hypothetical protein HXX76_014511 [Chlamydomonas incerta]|uniref:protein-tyrosine-phosphatase n=1 Tax=Chlamydomonas incerta TaxID=51695 RepID=A0A835SLF0_CHLIN|nr:hypothetical protein HXX76_014511 [Chlamydomonas incerta]|eukprot:KAG2424459.1 hypothetical protein HXX76_014511 [Chlamydomonas incerta]